MILFDNLHFLPRGGSCPSRKRYERERENPAQLSPILRRFYITPL